MIDAVLGKQVGNDFRAAAALEVDVEVTCLTFRTEEALEDEVVLERIDRADEEQVSHNRIRARSSAVVPDTLPLREAADVPHQQVVVLGMRLFDDAQFVLDPLVNARQKVGGGIRIASGDGFQAELAQVLDGGHAIRQRILRHFLNAVLQVELASLGDFDGVGDG